MGTRLTAYDQLRACHVRRWHIVQVRREQTLAEHSFAVAVIAGSLANKMRFDALADPRVALELLLTSLTHDLPEVKTGDTPTPFKRALEAVSYPGVVEKAEAHLGLVPDPDSRSVSPECAMIVKLADLIEAVFFLRDNAIGRHAYKVLSGIQSNLEQEVQRADREWPLMRVRDAVIEVCESIGIEIWVDKE